MKEDETPVEIPQGHATENKIAHYRELWEQSCEHVAEACKILGVDPEKIPADTWALREAAARTASAMRKLRMYLAGAIGALSASEPTAPNPTGVKDLYDEMLIVLEETAWIGASTDGNEKIS